jgi:hypothetical protein
METAVGGMTRCDCARGKALAGASELPSRSPVVSAEAAMICVEMMTGIGFFPPEAGARGDLADEIASMCETVDQAKWLAKRMNRLYRKWPGTADMRMVFCSRYQPLDGIQPIGISEVYPEGVPSERENSPLSLPVAARQLRAAPADLTASPSIQSSVAALAQAKNLNRVLKSIAAPVVPDIPVIRLTDANRITQADIDREISRRRDPVQPEETIMSGCG